jgi:hypothetical protein
LSHYLSASRINLKYSTTYNQTPMAHDQHYRRVTPESANGPSHDPDVSRREYREITVRDHGRMIAGDVYGNVQINSVDHRSVFQVLGIYSCNHRHVLTTSFVGTIMDSLHFQGMERYHVRPLESHPGTFDWIFDQESRLYNCDFSVTRHAEKRWSEYECYQVEDDLRKHASKLRTWLETSDDIFWVQGKAGSGKSTFMKFLFEHDQTRACLRRWSNGNVVIIAAFFFWAASSSELEKSYIGLLRALLYQILVGCPELVQQVLSERWQAASCSMSYTKPWTKNDLLSAFARLLQVTETTARFCFLIDGLDEFDGDHRDLIDAINLLNRSSVIKIYVSSRPWNMFQEAYGCNDNLHITLHSLTRRDIVQYVGASLRMPVPGILSESEIRQLENALCDKAEGVILWVTLAVKDLRRGIGEHDRVEMLQRRLNEYPSELQDFIEHTFNQIDPVYRKLAGRLLLMMLELSWEPSLASIPFLEDFTTNEDVVFGTQWSVESSAKMPRLVDRAILCANKWCRDLLQPVHVQNCRGAIDDLPPDCAYFYIRTDGTNHLSFGHRTIYQFVKEKAEQGKLLDMAGHDFSPQLASLYAAVEVSRYGLDIYDFDDIFRDAILCHCNREYSNSVMVGDTATKIDACLAAFDIVGQAMERPLHWSHWTACGLTQRGDSDVVKILGRTPSGTGYTSLVSYCVGLHANDDSQLTGIVAKGRRYDNLSSKKKQFVLEILLLPVFYRAQYIHIAECSPVLPTEHYNVFVKALASGIDVNQPTPRSGCRTDYTVWHIYLLRLYDWFNMKCQYFRDSFAFADKDAKNLTADLEFLTKIFQLFLNSGADPFTVISSGDLLQDDQQEGSARKPTFLTVADIVEDLRAAVVSISASSQDFPAWYAAWEAAIAAFETSLQEAFAQRYAASRSALSYP